MGAAFLPVTGLDVELRAPAGAEDLLLVEGGTLDMRLAVALVERLVREPDGASVDPRQLPIAELDLLLLRMRQRLIGDLVSADERCTECGARVDISFSIAAFLAHHVPTIPQHVTSTDEHGWYQLADDTLAFRLPRVADHFAIERSADPEQAIVRRCIRGTPTDEQRERIEAAMECMAPNLCADLEGSCPECTRTVTATFDPVQYTLRELRDQALAIYDDICAIAHQFHWSEAEILALPSARRARYAELAVEHARHHGISG